jgi:hypothetical protein
MDRVVRDRNVLVRIPETLFGRLDIVDKALQAGLESKTRMFRDYAEWLHQNIGSDNGRIRALRLETDRVNSRITNSLSGEGAKDPDS